MSEVLKKFGKYFLLDLVAQGGMAEIYRSRMATPDGGKRLVAIKRVLPSFSQNNEFVSMFKGEINTTSGFTHPNIVQIYDFGDFQGQLYLAMELVDGRNLRQYMGRAIELKQPFPVDVAAHVIEQSASGLHYAHTFKDKFSGKSMNIVHRDISPQNILVGYDGAVKVIDFGIAKGQGNSEHTRTGIIKGKPSYLSPEQIAGEELDGRSDIFALGIVLWEVLCGRKLFAADNDFAIIKLIENCEATVKKPSDYNANVPPELDAIVLKCLKKRREERFSNGEELSRALRKFLSQNFPEFSSGDVAFFAKNLFKNEIVEDRQKLQKMNEKAEGLLSLDTNEDARTRVGGANDQTATIPMSQTKLNNSFRTIDYDKNDKSSTNIRLEQTKSSTAIRANSNVRQMPSSRATSAGLQKPVEKSKSPFVAVATIAALAAGGYYYYDQNIAAQKNMAASEKKVSKLATLKIESNIQAASVNINGKDLQNSLPATIESLPVGEPLKVVIFSNGYVKQEHNLVLNAGENPVLKINLVREAGDASTVALAQGGKEVPLSLNITPYAVGVETTVKINGKPVDPKTAVGTVPIGQPFEVVVQREGFRSYKKVLTVTDEQVASNPNLSQEVQLEAVKYGTLSIKTVPSADLSMIVDGVEEKGNTTFFRKNIPVGTYKVKLHNDALGIEKEIDVTVNEGQAVEINDSIENIGKSNRLPANR